MNNDQMAHEESDPAPSLEKAKSQGLGWRTGIAIVALVIVAILAYPFIQEQLNPSQPATSVNVSPVSQSQVTAPEATAQANPDSAEAQFELGNAYVQSGQWDQAQAAFQRAIELDPNLQGAYANLGVVYYQLEKLDLAASQYQKALELNPNDGDVAYNLGALYLQQALLNSTPPNPDLLQQAIAQLKHAQELDPTLAEPYFSLGVAYNALNQKEEAIQAFETFLERDTGHDPRASQEAQRYLEALRQ
jgi:tetratricopeptide (TPR) repeat protein